MKRLIIVAIWLSCTGLCMAQESNGEIQGFFQRIQNFDFNSGDASFSFKGANPNGGGFGFVYNITDVFGLFQRTGFSSGIDQGGYKMNLITESQGLRLKKQAGSVMFYALGGVGFNRYVYNDYAGYYGMALMYGGGMQVPMMEGLNLIFEATNLTMGLPNLTNIPGRSKWDNALMFSIGAALHF